MFFFFKYNVSVIYERSLDKKKLEEWIKIVNENLNVCSRAVSIFLQNGQWQLYLSPQVVQKHIHFK